MEIYISRLPAFWSVVEGGREGDEKAFKHARIHPLLMRNTMNNTLNNRNCGDVKFETSNSFIL